MSGSHRNSDVWLDIGDYLLYIWWVMYGTDDKTSRGQKVSFNLQPRWYLRLPLPVSLLMRYFCEGAGSSLGLPDRTKGETNTTDVIKEGGTTLEGWDSPEMRRLTLRNGLYELPGYRRRKPGTN